MPMWILAAVRLGFGDAPPHDGSILQPTAKPRADERLRRRHRVNRIIVCRQSAHNGILRKFQVLLTMDGT